MFWLIVVIVIVGILIIDAIQRNTNANVLIAQQESARKEQEKLSSPEYIAQQQVSMNYFSYLGDKLDIEIRMVEAKIKLYNPPKFIHVFIGKSGQWLTKPYIITADKETYEANKATTNIKLVGSDKIVEKIKQDIRSEKELLESVEADYKNRQAEHPGYRPESLEVMRTKYELDVPFAPDYENDYWNEDNVSSWSMYIDKQQELNRLTKRLNNLKDPKTRQQTLEAMAKPKSLDRTNLENEKIYEEAAQIVRDAGKASTSLLQRRLGIGYGTAARLIDQLEEEGVIGAADGLTPRKVLHP